MKSSTIILVASALALPAFMTSCVPPNPPMVVEQYDVTIVQPKPKPTPKPVYREPAPEEFRAVTSPN